MAKRKIQNSYYLSNDWLIMSLIGGGGGGGESKKL